MCAIFAGSITADARNIVRDGIITLATGLILIFFMAWGHITRMASVLILVYLFYLWLLIKAQKQYSDGNKKKNFKKKEITIKELLLVILGIIGLIIGCRILVFTGTELAQLAGISEMIMGLFILSIGTSIPEMMVTITSA